MALKSNIPRLRRAIAPALDEGVGEVAALVKRERDARVPVDTGALQRSGRVVRHAEAHYEVREGDGLSYARYVEYGTSRAAAQPHMTPAAEEGRQQMRGIVRAKVGRAIKGAAL